MQILVFTGNFKCASTDTKNFLCIVQLVIILRHVDGMQFVVSHMLQCSLSFLLTLNAHVIKEKNKKEKNALDRTA